MSFSASVGLAIAPTHGTTPAKLLANADFAMRRARLNGGDRRQFFEPIQRNAHRARRNLELELKRAWADQEFEVLFQPQVGLRDERIVGAEALLRWRHPEQGLLLPGAFLHELKNNRLAGPVGDHILNVACREANRLRERSGRPFRIGVNLFERQFLAHDLPQRVEAALRASGLPSEAFELEIIETIMTGSDEASIRRVRRLRDLGVGIAFDDYGTGYASLGLLKRYPISRLKIDRSFVRDIVVDDHDVTIVELILTLGRRFGMDVVAEGVETADQALRLIELGCNEAQGFLFGRPMPIAELDAMMAAQAAAEPSGRPTSIVAA